MAEIRISKLIKQYCVGLDTLVDFFNSLGANIKDANPNMKVSDEYLPALEKRFGKDRKLKETAEKVEVKASNIIESVRPKLPASVAPDEFDWDAFENEGTLRVSTKVSHQQGVTLARVLLNEITEGVVTSINKREVTVNIGDKSEGVIPASEFRYNPKLQVGDKVEVLVERAEDATGQIVLSHKKARHRTAWDKVNAAYESAEVVNCYVKTRTKGGLIVDTFGIEAFLPESQVDTKYVKDFDPFVDTNIDVLIIKICQDLNNIVVSRKAVLKKEISAGGGIIGSNKKVTKDTPRPEVHPTPQDKPIPQFNPESFFSEKALNFLKKKNGQV